MIHNLAFINSPTLKNWKEIQIHIGILFSGGTLIGPNDTTLEGDCDVPNQKVTKVSFHENTLIQ